MKDDSDGDGFFDDVDICRNSKPWHPINELGCAISNTPLEISVSGVNSSTNESGFLNISWSVVDKENDDVVLNLILLNPSYSIPIAKCSSSFK